MSSFFRDLPGPVRDRRASLPAHRQDDTFLRGGGDEDDRFVKKALEEPGDRGLLDGADPQFGSDDWLEIGANPGHRNERGWAPVPTMEQQQAEQARQNAQTSYLHDGQQVDSERAGEWVRERYRQVNTDPAAQLPQDWAAREHDPDDMLAALEAQEENPTLPDGSHVKAETYLNVFERKYNPYLKDGPKRPRGNSRGMLDDFDEEFAAGQSLDDQDVELPAGAPSNAPHRLSNYRESVYKGKTGLKPIHAREEALTRHQEWAHQRRVNQQMTFLADGQAIASNDPRVAGLDPNLRGLGREGVARKARAAPAPAQASASAPKNKRSVLHRLFNMKSGYANPLAWLYQAGKGIGKGLSSLFGGGGQQQEPETLGEDDGYESFAAERERLRGALFGPKQVKGP